MTSQPNDHIHTPEDSASPYLELIADSQEQSDTPLLRTLTTEQQQALGHQAIRRRSRVISYQLTSTSEFNEELQNVAYTVALRGALRVAGMYYASKENDNKLQMAISQAHQEATRLERDALGALYDRYDQHPVIKMIEGARTKSSGNGKKHANHLAQTAMVLFRSFEQK